MRQAQRLAFVTLVGLFLAGVLPLPLHALEKWGPFRGQLVDVETGEPIADAAILVVWWEDVYTPVQVNSKFYEAREAVTDVQGRFEVPRLDPPFFRFRIRPPEIIYFAPGYEGTSRVVTPPDGQPFVAPTVVKMRRLKTREELLSKSRGYPSRIPEDKMLNFLRAINVERRMLGLRPEGEKKP